MLITVRTVINTHEAFELLEPTAVAPPLLSAAGRLLQRHEGSHISACQWSFVIGMPLRIGHSQAKFATTSPT